MRGLERNSAFFQLVKEAESAAGQGGLSRLFKTAKESGKLNLSGRALSAIPDTAFALATTLDEGGKFWEVNPLTRLDLSSNELKDIPEGKFQLINNDLAYLNLKNNKLHSIPEDLFSCLQLKYLDLSTNGLTIITDSIGVLIELKELMLSENKLVAVPDTLHYCAVLQTLELQNNYLTKIPLATLVLPHLLNLNLSSNKLTEIPASISGLKLLEIFDISKNYIKSLPDLSEMRSLRLLSAFNNRITCMPTLPSRGQLDRIHFGENLLTDLDMASLKASAGTLTELLLQGNQLSICPESIHSLHSLKILDLSNNCLTNLPHALGYMTSLYKILVEGNPIRTVRRTLLSTPAAEELKVYLRTRGPPPLELSGGQHNIPHSSEVESSRIDQKHLSVEDAWQASYSTAAKAELLRQLQWRVRDGTGHTLNLSGLGTSTDFLSLVYKNIEESPTFLSLTSLNLSSNNLVVFPSMLHHLSGLKKLVLASNEISSTLSFHSGTGSGNSILKSTSPFHFPPSLIHLDVSSNRLSSSYLQALLTALSSQSIFLLELLAGSNHLSEIPISINLHKRLREVRFPHNQISTLRGVNFVQIKSLEILDLRNNKITVMDVPFPFSLSSLILSNNSIVDVPTGLTSLPNLQTLQLTGNPIKNIRSDVISLGADALMAVLRKRGTVSTQSFTVGLKGASKIRPAWDGAEDLRSEQFIYSHIHTQDEGARLGSYGDQAHSYDCTSRSQSTNKMREMAVKKAQAQGQSQQSLKNKPSISFHETYSSGHRSNYPPPVSGPILLSSSPRTDHNTKALALEIAELEREMENCSNSVRRLQIRKSIASRRADMLRPM